MNGVNMLYKGIEDPSIHINVILSEFIIFTTQHHFPHNKSRMVPYNGIDYMNVLPYLSDIKEWDKKTDVRNKKTFSHGMLFSRYVR
ncbi:hypothetical protein CHS0354_009891 [Potamilus streckersoni]|uniref:Uncharacterized protein n=1 Tax=Potamilus streckersoni TaxID=2493646 RepID=A0AAE0VNS7_9BIVA|nr:hypothetical protein CHS0354_009891 [Potamilus streckersoni]